MTPYTLLLPDNLTSAERRMMLAALTSQRISQPAAVAYTWGQVAATGHRVVLSVGKGALDLWHEWGLIRVGHQHGDVFRHDSRTVMVVEHPGAMLQLQWTGRTARQAMAVDLTRFRMLLEGQMDVDQLAGRWCAVCLGKRASRQRTAVEWPGGLDGCGLCDDHARKKAQLSRKVKPRVNPGSPAAQIPGQVEGFGFVNGHAVVAKR